MSSPVHTVGPSLMTRTYALHDALKRCGCYACMQEIARERDEATQALETRTRQLDRAQRDWALERQVRRPGDGGRGEGGGGGLKWGEGLGQKRTSDNHAHIMPFNNAGSFLQPPFRQDAGSDKRHTFRLLCTCTESGKRDAQPAQGCG